MPGTDKIITLPIKELTARIRKKEITATQVTTLFLEQIGKFNPLVNAIVECHPEDALMQARLLDEKQARGEELGPLHGVVFTIKDIFDVEGYKTTAGCVALENNIAKVDAEIVKRLKQAGAICIGKTNMPEFENGPTTKNNVYPETKNPNNLNHTAGGSSGGCGAAVRIRFCNISIGSDHGGSIRIPAADNGDIGFRSTTGRISSAGVLGGVRSGPGAILNTEAPITSYVDDIIQVINVIQGPDGIDNNVKVFPPLEYSNKPVNEMKIAFDDNDGNSIVIDEIKLAIRNVADMLKDLGAQVENKKPARIGEGYDIYKEFSAPLAVKSYQESFAKYNMKEEDISDLLKQKIKNFTPFSNYNPTLFQKTCKKREKFQQDIEDFFKDYDALIFPVTASTALPLTEPMWRGKEHYLSYCWDTSAAGLPSIVIPVEETEKGLPVAVQILTKRNNENVILTIAKKIEEKLGGWKMPLLLNAPKEKVKEEERRSALRM